VALGLGITIGALLSLMIVRPEAAPLDADAVHKWAGEHQFHLVTDEAYQAYQKALEKNDENGAKKVSTEPAKQVTMLYLPVRKGMTSEQIAEALAEARIIASPEDFLDPIKSKGLTRKLRLGNYLLRSDMTVEQMIWVLTGTPE
jgi:hypothetical protein